MKHLVFRVKLDPPPPPKVFDPYEGLSEEEKAERIAEEEAWKAEQEEEEAAKLDSIGSESLLHGGALFGTEDTLGRPKSPSHLLSLDRPVSPFGRRGSGGGGVSFLDDEGIAPPRSGGGKWGALRGAVNASGGFRSGPGSLRISSTLASGVSSDGNGVFGPGLQLADGTVGGVGGAEALEAAPEKPAKSEPPPLGYRWNEWRHCKQPTPPPTPRPETPADSLDGSDAMESGDDEDEDEDDLSDSDSDSDDDDDASSAAETATKRAAAVAAAMEAEAPSVEDGMSEEEKARIAKLRRAIEARALATFKKHNAQDMHAIVEASTEPCIGRWLRGQSCLGGLSTLHTCHHACHHLQTPYCSHVFGCGML